MKVVKNLLTMVVLLVVLSPGVYGCDDGGGGDDGGGSNCDEACLVPCEDAWTRCADECEAIEDFDEWEACVNSCDYYYGLCGTEYCGCPPA